MSECYVIMTSVLKKSRGSKGKSESMQEELPSRWGAGGYRKEDVSKLIKYIDDSVVGKGDVFCGPFGRRKEND
ncbi:putative Y71H2B.5 [Operophtera brumata]|uniref:Putative Y71H2B.5 n=1 Tax=Operophtera brumata TaxID=104452 RepID=A0A0L7L474_OPEBR|nr:putative Y71H2B.5 [Operophtera brumata]